MPDFSSHNASIFQNQIIKQISSYLVFGYVANKACSYVSTTITVCVEHTNENDFLVSSLTEMEKLPRLEETSSLLHLRRVVHQRPVYRLKMPGLGLGQNAFQPSDPINLSGGKCKEVF